MSRARYRRANPDLDPWFALVDRVEGRAPEPTLDRVRRIADGLPTLAAAAAFIGGDRGLSEREKVAEVRRQRERRGR